MAKSAIKSVDADKGVIEVDAEVLQLIGKVRTFDADIASFKSRIKGIKERQQEILDELEEYAEVERLVAELTTAREALKRRLESNGEYMHLTEELADEKLALRDAEGNMSEFLLGYFHETGEKQIELGPQNAREVILKGKLGKQKDFQTNMFSRMEAES